MYYILGDPAEVSQPGCSPETPGELGQNTDSQTQPLETRNHLVQGEAQEHTFLQGPQMMLMSVLLCLRTTDKYSEREKKNVENDITLKSEK